VLWTCSENAKNKCNIDTTVIPVPFRGIGWDAQVQPPFALPFRHGDMVLIVGWAILRPSSTSSMRYGKDLGHGKRRARRHADHGASVEPRAVLTDCASFIIMEKQGITEALTYDGHYVQRGYAALLRE
jgi:hypothetical protein